MTETYSFIQGVGVAGQIKNVQQYVIPRVSRTKANRWQWTTSPTHKTVKQTTDSRICNRCGMQGHIRRQCQLQVAYCTFCNAESHTMGACRDRAAFIRDNPVSSSRPHITHLETAWNNQQLTYNNPWYNTKQTTHHSGFQKCLWIGDKIWEILARFRRVNIHSTVQYPRYNRTAKQWQICKKDKGGVVSKIVEMSNKMEFCHANHNIWRIGCTTITSKWETLWQMPPYRAHFKTKFHHKQQTEGANNQPYKNSATIGGITSVWAVSNLSTKWLVDVSSIQQGESNFRSHEEGRHQRFVY